jgi:hypothetical protein
MFVHTFWTRPSPIFEKSIVTCHQSSSFLSIYELNQLWSVIKMTSSSDIPFPHPRRLPNEAEVQQCKAIITEMDKDINVLELQMEKLNERLQDLKRKRANHVSYLAPFRRLPAEILCKIGVLCLHNEDSITTITSIHSSIRDAMIGMPSLWRYIRLVEKSSGRDNEEVDDEDHGEDKSRDHSNDKMEDDEDDDEDPSDDNEEEEEDEDDEDREAPFTYHYQVSRWARNVLYLTDL